MNAQLTDMGRQVKMKLLEMGKSQNWLIEQVTEKTGLYFDTSYLWKILNGKQSSPKIIAAICEVLGLENPAA